MNLYDLFDFSKIKQTKITLLSIKANLFWKKKYNPYEKFVFMTATVYPVNKKVRQVAYTMSDNSCYALAARWLKNEGSLNHVVHFLGSSVIGSSHVIVTYKNGQIVFGLTNKNDSWVKFAKGLDRVWSADFSVMEQLLPFF